MAGAGYVVFLVWAAYLVAAATVVFSRGFLLAREAQLQAAHCEGEAGSSPGDGGCSPARARAIVLLVDALGWSAAQRLQATHALLEEYPDRTRMLRFLADPPTTTLQRLKGITTGSLPTFIDAGSNFATPEINEDNVIDQLIKMGGKAVLLGDDTWEQLYPKRWLRSMTMPSFNTWDLDTVDNAIKARLPEEIKKNDWNLLVAHFLGVDHCGHRYGPNHPEMTRKLSEMDQVIRDVMDLIDNDTVVFVIGDHGMTETGDHGGDTEAEITAAMFMYSPYKLLSPPERLSPKVVRQVDFVPTLASILGLPSPYSNLGAIILNALPFSGNPDIPYEDWQFALINLWTNVQQVTNYIQKYAEVSDQFPYDKIEMVDKKYNILSQRVQSIYNEKAFYSFATDAREFLIEIRSMCQEVWVQFDSFSMSRGLLLIFLAIFFCYMVVDGIPSSRLPEIFQSSFLWFSYGAMFLVTVLCVICHMLSLIDNLELTILFSTGMVSTFMFSMLVIQNWELIAQHWYENVKKRNWLDFIAKVTLAMSACALFSNSYVVEEGSVLSFLLITLVLCACYQGGHPKVLFPLFIGIGVTMTLSRLYRSCREEQGDCYFKTGYTNQTTQAHLVMALVALALFISLTRYWLRMCGNLLAPDAILWRYTPTVVAVCTGAHWVITWGPHKPSWKVDSLARIVFGILAVTVIVLIIRPLSVFVIPKNKEYMSVYGHANVVPQLFNQMKGMFNKNSAARKETKDEDVPVVCGLATAYSAAYVMLSICITLFIALLLGAKAAPAIILLSVTAALVLAVLSIVRYNTATTLNELINVDACGIQCWLLLSLYFFYATGHQATLSSIQWGAAFIGTGGNFSSYIIPALLVIVNTFGSQLIIGLCIPLLVMAPFSLFVIWGPPNKQSKFDVSKGEYVLYECDTLLTGAVFNTSAKYILFHAVRMFMCMLAATVHCRHLMVWKVFAPKLIFEGIGLLVTIAGVLLSYLFLIRVHSRMDAFLNKITKSS